MREEKYRIVFFFSPKLADKTQTHQRDVAEKKIENKPLKITIFCRMFLASVVLIFHMHSTFFSV